MLLAVPNGRGAHTHFWEEPVAHAATLNDESKYALRGFDETFKPVDRSTREKGRVWGVTSDGIVQVEVKVLRKAAPGEDGKVILKGVGFKEGSDHLKDFQDQAQVVLAVLRCYAWDDVGVWEEVDLLIIIRSNIRVDGRSLMGPMLLAILSDTRSAVVRQDMAFSLEIGVETGKFLLPVGLLPDKLKFVKQAEGFEKGPCGCNDDFEDTHYTCVTELWELINEAGPYTIDEEGLKGWDVNTLSISVNTAGVVKPRAVKPGEVAAEVLEVDSDDEVTVVEEPEVEEVRVIVLASKTSGPHIRITTACDGGNAAHIIGAVETVLRRARDDAHIMKQLFENFYGTGGAEEYQDISLHVHVAHGAVLDLPYLPMCAFLGLLSLTYGREGADLDTYIFLLGQNYFLSAQPFPKRGTTAAFARAMVRFARKEHRTIVTDTWAKARMESVQAGRTTTSRWWCWRPTL